jgi:hypothetical protein
MIRLLCSDCGVELRPLGNDGFTYVCPCAQQELTRDAQGKLPRGTLHQAVTLHRFPRLWKQPQGGGRRG